MRLFKIIFLLLLSHITCYGQNLRNSDSLPYGHWRETYDNTIEEGNYKIVSLRDYDTIKCGELYAAFRMGCDIKYKGSREQLFFTIGLSKDSISINDSIWVITDPFGRTEKYYENGIQLWGKTYSPNSELILHDDYEFSSFSYYRHGRLFRKRYFLPEDHNDLKVAYYPNDALSISDAELSFYINFLTDPIDTNTIMLSSRSTSTITGFSSKYLKLLDSQNNPVRFPIKITGTPTKFHLATRSFTPFNNKLEEWSIIHTAEAPYTYDLACSIEGAHIDFVNVSVVDTIRLSATKDKYLGVCGAGTLSTVHIKGDAFNQDYGINGSNCISIDLLTIPQGIYKMEVFTEENGNPNITLQITK